MPQRGAVRHDLVALVQQPLLPDLLQRPPDGLDVVVVEREVRLVGVDPEGDPLGQPRPLVDVLEHRLAALLVELGNPVALDVVLVVEAELALDLELDRQPVAVPAALAVHLVAAHRLEAGEDVLEHPAQDVVRVGRAVGGRRALVEDELRAALTAPDRLVEDVALAPALEDLLLELGERLGGIYRPVAGHGRAILGSGSDENGGCHGCCGLHRRRDVPPAGAEGHDGGRDRHRSRRRRAGDCDGRPVPPRRRRRPGCGARRARRRGARGPHGCAPARRRLRRHGRLRAGQRRRHRERLRRGRGRGRQQGRAPLIGRRMGLRLQDRHHRGRAAREPFAAPLHRDEGCVRAGRAQARRDNREARRRLRAGVAAVGGDPVRTHQGGSRRAADEGARDPHARLRRRPRRLHLPRAHPPGGRGRRVHRVGRPAGHDQGVLRPLRAACSARRASERRPPRVLRPLMRLVPGCELRRPDLPHAARASIRTRAPARCSAGSRASHWRKAWRGPRDWFREVGLLE